MLLQEQADHERQAVVADHEREPADHRDDHGAGAKQLQRHHRVSDNLLRADEPGQRSRGDSERGDHGRVAEPVRSGLDGAEGQPGHRQHAGDLPDQVERHDTRLRGADAGQQQQGDRADRDVDEEDQPPVDEVQHAAKHRT
jgi:hypothetical protein